MATLKFLLLTNRRAAVKYSYGGVSLVLSISLRSFSCMLRIVIKQEQAMCAPARPPVRLPRVADRFLPLHMQRYGEVRLAGCHQIIFQCMLIYRKYNREISRIVCSSIICAKKQMQQKFPHIKLLNRSSTLHLIPSIIII